MKPLSHLAVLIALLGFANASSAQPKKAEEPIKRPPELEVLDRFVGKWDVTLEVKRSVWSKEELKGLALETAEAVVEGSYVAGRTVGESGKVISMWMWGYDQNIGGYRLWWFGIGGQVTEWMGSWNPATKTLTLKSEIGQDMISTATIVFKDDGTHTHEVLVKGGDGKIYQHAIATSVKRPK